MDFSAFTHLTFDCYGTLIDWESGILEALLPLFESRGVVAGSEQILRLYTQAESAEESGEYRTYRSVLERVAGTVAAELGVMLLPEDRHVLPDSVGRWPPFPDTVRALRLLKTRFKLVILSNIDNALFAETRPLLGVEFDEVITAEQLRGYKPRKGHFEEALRRLAVPKEQILHVAQSLYHDHVPAKQMGFSTVWINRPSRLSNLGLSLPASVRPDLEFRDLQSLADAVIQTGA